MTDFTQKVILAGVGLSLTAVAVILYLTTFQRLQDASDRMEAANQIQQAWIEDSAVTRYDGCRIYGSQVISYLKSNWAYFEKVTLDGNPVTDTNHFRDRTSGSYIDSNAVYLITLQENSNKVPRIVVITKQ